MKIVFPESQKREEMEPCKVSCQYNHEKLYSIAKFKFSLAISPRLILGIKFHKPYGLNRQIRVNESTC